MTISESEDWGQCVCGCAWFTIEPEDDADLAAAGAAVCISFEGEVTGYAGKLVCSECDTDWNPNMRFSAARGHLRVVK